MTFAVHVSPRSGKSQAAGVHDGALKIRLAAPPVDGAANDALIAWLAKALSAPKLAVTIVSGLASKRKRVRVDGTTEAAVRALCG